MEDNLKRENARAERISFRIYQHYLALANIYENLVDRDFDLVKEDIKEIITDLRLILQSIEEDDF
jgi:hypothetical protein